MVSRALGLAAVLLLMCGGLEGPAQAQENLDAGKSPSQLFAGNCNACHKSPRGLLKTVAPGSLPGFLRQHYTTGPEMAGVLSSYLVSNGAGDVRTPARAGGRGAKSDAATSDQSEPTPRAKRHGKRSARPNSATEAKPEAKPEARPDAEPADAPKPASAVRASEAPRSEASEPSPTSTQSIPASSSGGSDPAAPSR
jgi:hypothetical protein